MFRKLTLALGATVAIAAAATTMSSTTASAGHGWHGHHGGHHGWHRWNRGWGFYAPTFVAGGYCYTVKRVVPTYYGPRVRYVQVCN